MNNTLNLFAGNALSATAYIFVFEFAARDKGCVCWMRVGAKTSATLRAHPQTQHIYSPHHPDDEARRRAKYVTPSSRRGVVTFCEPRTRHTIAGLYRVYDYRLFWWRRVSVYSTIRMFVCCLRQLSTISYFPVCADARKSLETACENPRARAADIWRTRRRRCWWLHYRVRDLAPWHQQQEPFPSHRQTVYICITQWWDSQLVEDRRETSTICVCIYHINNIRRAIRMFPISAGVFDCVIHLGNVGNK